MTAVRSPESIVLSCLIDDGCADRGHRAMMLNCDLRYVGLAFGPHESQGYVCILLFVDSFQSRATKNDALPRRKTAVAEHFGVDSWDHIVASVTTVVYLTKVCLVVGGWSGVEWG